MKTMDRWQLLEIIKSLPHQSNCKTYLVALTACNCARLHLLKDLQFGTPGRTLIDNIENAVNMVDKLPHKDDCIIFEKPGQCNCGKELVFEYLWKLVERKRASFRPLE